MRQRLPGGDDSRTLARIEVARRVDLALPVLKGALAGVDQCRFCERRARISLESRFECSRINERFEDGAGGAFRHCMIELTEAIVATTRKGQDLSRVRVHRDQCNLGHRPLPHGCLNASLLPAYNGLTGALLPDHFIHFLQTGIDSFYCYLL